VTVLPDAQLEVTFVDGTSGNAGMGAFTVCLQFDQSLTRQARFPASTDFRLRRIL
jgi:hypothetical protein